MKSSDARVKSSDVSVKSSNKNGQSRGLRIGLLMQLVQSVASTFDPHPQGNALTTAVTPHVFSL